MAFLSFLGVMLLGVVLTYEACDYTIVFFQGPTHVLTELSLIKHASPFSRVAQAQT